MPEEITWRAAERQHKPKGALWYAGVAAAVLILATLAAIRQNFFFGVFIILAGALLVFRGKERPQILDFSVSEKGVGIGKQQFYPYDELEWFAILEREDMLDQLVIKRKVSINPHLKIPIDRKHIGKVRKMLEEELEEKTYEPSLLDTIIERLGL